MLSGGFQFIEDAKVTKFIIVDIKDIKFIIKGELQREKKLISYERVFKMLENDMYFAGIGQAVLKSDQGITKGESPYVRNFRKSSVIRDSFH